MQKNATFWVSRVRSGIDGGWHQRAVHGYLSEHKAFHKPPVVMELPQGLRVPASHKVVGSRVQCKTSLHKPEFSILVQQKLRSKESQFGEMMHPNTGNIPV